MSYQTYTTRAIVCGCKDSYTSDRSYLLFTEDAGMLWASARSVRMEKSKQRYALQDFSIIRVSLVKGKTGWKIGSVEAIRNPFLAARSRSERALATYLIRQLRRYVHGEEAQQKVFTDIWSLLSDPLVLADLETNVESIFTLRLLHQLGYVSPTPAVQSLVEFPDIVSALSYYTTDLSAVIAKLTNQAENASHL